MNKPLTGLCWGAIAAGLWRAACLLSICAVLIMAAPAAAQQPPPVALSIQAGYGEVYRIGHWFPVTFEVANDGPDIQATIEWRFADSEEIGFQRELDLPRGARKRLTLHLVSGDFARSAEVRLLSGQTELLKQRVALEPVDSGQFMIGVLSSDPTLLNSLESMQLDQVSSVTVTHIDPSLLPEEALVLNGLDAIFIHDVATADLSPGQRAALELWVRLGGQLVVSGGVSAERSTVGLADLLPAEVGQLQAAGSIEALQRIARRNDLVTVVPNTTLSQATPRPGAQAIDAAGLIIADELGAGRVLFTSFDLSALRPWVGEPDLYQRLLRAESRLDPGYAYRLRSDNLLRSTLQLPGLRFPSSLVLLGLVLAYIVLIGPVNFIVLRRMRRPDLAWVTVPAIVLICLLGTYGVSFLLRGTQPQVLQLTIAQGYEGQPRGTAAAFIGLFSPQRRDYSLSFTDDALISSRFFDGLPTAGATVHTTDSAVEVRDLLVDVSSLRTLIVEKPVDNIPAVSSQLQRSPDRVDGTFTYQGSVALEDAMIVYGDSVAPLGQLAPGQTEQVSLAAGLNNFPDGSIGNEQQIFNRGQVLTNLFDFDRFSFNGPQFDGTRGMPERDAVYLLGWVDTALLPVQLNGGGASQEGSLLYIIRLNS
jgi:hypothetical protein